MKTYFVRHTKKLDINAQTRARLWDERRIAIHYPHDIHNKVRKRDNASLNVQDYPRRAKGAMRALNELAKHGGYVCAEYFGHDECLVGTVKPGSKIQRLYGEWGTLNECDGREAILKSLKLERVRFVNPHDRAVILVGRPRQGTIMRWKTPGQAIADLVEGRRAAPSLNQLSTAQQEIMCSEFLRSSQAESLGVPRLAHLVLPLGRTMRDIDIYGISNSGRRLFAQVTYLHTDSCESKKKALLRYRHTKNDLVLFCDCAEPAFEKGVWIVPIGDVYQGFVKNALGKKWLQVATQTRSRGDRVH